MESLIKQLSRLSRWMRNLILLTFHPRKLHSGPVISVVIPIYDRTDQLIEAIESVLNQDYANIELLLVCDGSPSTTVEIVNNYLSDSRVRAVFLKGNSGNAVRARNCGIASSNGKYIAFLDSDDICTKERLSISVAILENDEIDVVYGSWFALMDGSRDISGLTNGQLVHSIEANFQNLWTASIPCQSTVTVRKEMFEKFGLIKPEMKYREDHELWLRLAYFGAQFRNVKFPFTHLRLHSGNNEINFESDTIFWLEKTQKNYDQLGPSIESVRENIPDQLI
jgi:glycosyltransferase involved in cell wall biosynthesis